MFKKKSTFINLSDRARSKAKVHYGKDIEEIRIYSGQIGKKLFLYWIMQNYWEMNVLPQTNTEMIYLESEL
jgi:hypothetical protein